MIVGLLGGVAAGKSTVGRLLVGRGAHLVDADELAHGELLRPEVRARIAAEVGAEALDERGSIDRKALGRLVFGDRERLARLEAIVHPGVRAAIARELDGRRSAPGAPREVVVLDVPLLAESDAGLLARCDEVLFVDASADARAGRARARGWPDGEVARREAHQRPLDEKRASASFRVRNDGALDETAAQVARFWDERVAPRRKQRSQTTTP